MDLIDILIVVAICVVCVVFIAGETTEKALDSFGAGFLPYRREGWPRGVQEGEPVAWDWSAMADRSVPAVDRPSAPDTPAEVFDIDDGGIDLDSIVDGHVGGGRALRS